MAKELDKLDFIPHGLKKLAVLCGERWPRQMPLDLAAAYAGLAGGASLLRIAALREMIYQFDGKDMIDRFDIDNWILDLKRSYESEKEKSKKKGDI